MSEVAGDETDTETNAQAMDDSLDRLRYLLACTRRGLISCLIMMAALFVLVVLISGLLVFNCIVSQCGVFPATSLGITLIFAVPALFVMFRASVNYAMVYTSHLQDYRNVVRVREFIRDVLNSVAK